MDIPPAGWQNQSTAQKMQKDSELKKSARISNHHQSDPCLRQDETGGRGRGHDSDLSSLPEALAWLNT